MIKKIQSDSNNFLFKELYYNRARDAMFDIIDNLSKKGYTEIYIPGYIGWSPNEGSGIFDPINKIVDLNRHYYVMDRELNTDINYLKINLNIGSRPIDQHLKGFRALGASVDILHGAVVAKAEKLTGKHIFLDMVSVGATINIKHAVPVMKAAYAP